MTRSKLKQPNYSLSDRDPGDALEGSARSSSDAARGVAMSGESFVDYLDASDDVFFIALGNVRVPLRLVQNIGQASRPNLNQQPSMQFGTGPV